MDAKKRRKLLSNIFKNKSHSRIPLKRGDGGMPQGRESPSLSSTELEVSPVLNIEVGWSILPGAWRNDISAFLWSQYLLFYLDLCCTFW